MGDLANKDRRILVADDDPESLKLVVKSLEWQGYTVEVANTGKEALDKIATWLPHLALLDVNMPELNGLETLKTLRAKNEYVSAIFVSANSTMEDVVMGLDAGADDYICKPFELSELLARVRCQLRIKDLQDELKRANEKLKELVDFDDLTGLFNMRALYPKLENEVHRARRYKRSVCVLMMDMDYFKNVNDRHDHLFGSFVLTEVGHMIRDNIRNIDFAARYGGDEYLIVLTEIDLNGATKFSERLRKLIEGQVFKNDLHQLKVTASLGFAIARPDLVLVDARSMVRHADKALYEAKESGRNCVRFINLNEQVGGADSVVEARRLRRSVK